MQLTSFLNSSDIKTLKGVSSDSRKVKEGFLFAALQGSKMAGTKFIEDAIHHGATHIVVQVGTQMPEGVPDTIKVIEVTTPRKAFAKIAAAFYQLQPTKIAAVTGTSGKTSTVSFVQQLWHLSGIKKCASLGTLGVRGPGLRKYSGLTTPDTQTLHADIADLAATGIEHLAIEASSHGLDQYRLDGLDIRVAAYTNLSRDHLDYHATMDDYFDAKSRLFSEVIEEGSTAVINADDEYADKLIEICKQAGHTIFTYGYKGDTLKLVRREAKPTGQEIVINAFGEDYTLVLPLVGEFQVMNALCALGMVLAYDNDPAKYIPLLSQLRGVAGRLQLVSGHPKGAVYIDYAHKPAALETILKTLRPHTQNKLVCVFGCGGNRDVGKRALMGDISSRLADVTIVTDDNPRYEEADDIRAQIMEAAPNALEIGDRAQAIQKAITNLSEGDILVIAGKGHEQGQIVGEEVLKFDDVDEAKKAIESLV